MPSVQRRRYLFHICDGNTTTYLRERLRPRFDVPRGVGGNKNKLRFPALAAEADEEGGGRNR